MSYNEIQRRKGTIENSNFSEETKRQLFLRVTDKGFWEFFKYQTK